MHLEQHNAFTSTKNKISSARVRIPRFLSQRSRRESPDFCPVWKSLSVESFDERRRTSEVSSKDSPSDGKENTYMWAGTSRGGKKKSTPTHQQVVRVMKPYFLAYLFSGAGGSGSSIWPEQRPAWLSGEMKKAWTNITDKLKRISGDCAVASRPEPFEARLEGLIRVEFRRLLN